jgi:hypothetical protein
MRGRGGSSAGSCANGSVDLWLVNGGLGNWFDECAGMLKAEVKKSEELLS